MELQVRNAGKLSVSDAAFGREFNEALVHQVVTAFMNGARAGAGAVHRQQPVSRPSGPGRAASGPDLRPTAL